MHASRDHKSKTKNVARLKLKIEFAAWLKEMALYIGPRKHPDRAR